jgi:hypothetical protein
MLNTISLLTIHSLPKEVCKRIVSEICSEVQLVQTTDLYYDIDQLLKNQNAKTVHTVLTLNTSESIGSSQVPVITKICEEFNKLLLDGVNKCTFGNNIDTNYNDEIVKTIVEKIGLHLEVTNSSYVKGCQIGINAHFNINSLVINILGSVCYDLKITKRFKIVGDNILRWVVRINLYITVIDTLKTPIMEYKNNKGYEWLDQHVAQAKAKASAQTQASAQE